MIRIYTMDGMHQDFRLSEEGMKKLHAAWKAMGNDTRYADYAFWFKPKDGSAKIAIGLGQILDVQEFVEVEQTC